MARVRFFAQAKDATGCRSADIEGATVAEVLEAAVSKFPDLSRVLEVSAVWLNGDPASPDEKVAPSDEVAVLPPVSGG